MAEKITIQVAFDQTAQSLGSIGRVGENIARQILFDCSSVLAGRTNASIICVVKRPKDVAPYTATLTQVGITGIYRLILTSTEVAVAGTVQIELRLVDGEEILKAAICTGTVENSMTGISDTPDEPIADVLNRLEAALKKAESMGGGENCECVEATDEEVLAALMETAAVPFLTVDGKVFTIDGTPIMA